MRQDNQRSLNNEHFLPMFIYTLGHASYIWNDGIARDKSSTVFRTPLGGFEGIMRACDEFLLPESRFPWFCIMYAFPRSSSLPIPHTPPLHKVTYSQLLSILPFEFYLWDFVHSLSFFLDRGHAHLFLYSADCYAALGNEVRKHFIEDLSPGIWVGSPFLVRFLSKFKQCIISFQN